MTFLWLLVWVCSDTPALTTSPSLNNWMIALIVCVVIDVLGLLKRRGDDE